MKKSKNKLQSKTSIDAVPDAKISLNTDNLIPTNLKNFSSSSLIWKDGSKVDSISLNESRCDDLNQNIPMSSANNFFKANLDPHALPSQTENFESNNFLKCKIQKRNCGIQKSKGLLNKIYANNSDTELDMDIEDLKSIKKILISIQSMVNILSRYK